MSIKLSPKHGLNPSIVRCPICKKDIAIAVLGRLKGDVEAPRYIEDSLCDECKKEYATIIECSNDETPTGRKGFIPKKALTVDGDFFRMYSNEFSNLFKGNG